MHNPKYEFSPVELELINKFTKRINGTITKTTHDRKEKYFIASESLNACIRMTGLEERTIFFCAKIFDTYHDAWCTNPSELKTALSL